MGARRTRPATASVALALALALLGACGGGGDDDDTGSEPPEAVVHVALGDSFSAGEGAPPYDAEPESCRRAEEAWPRLLDRAVARIVSVDLRACAGAQTEHLLDLWTSRGLEAQIPMDPDPTVTLVTITIGGNDIGFGDIVLSCVLLTCSPEPGSDDLEARLDALQTALVEEVHPALVAAYPNADIVHVGYPHLAPLPTLDPEGCPWMSGEDQRLARGIVDALDDAVRDAAQRSGTARFVDVRTAFAGHELCTDDPWVNAIGLGAGGAHPNAAGQMALAEAVADGLDLGGGADGDRS
jgi:lysophospholipase L1-like esterase